MSDENKPPPMHPNEMAPTDLSQVKLKPVSVVKLNSQATALVTEMTEASGIPPADIVRKAIGLYKLALDAHMQGKHVGTADEPGSLDTEFVGF